MPNSFIAQVYDLGDPWAAREKGWTGGDPENCSLPNPANGKYGPNCTAWDASKWSAAMQKLAPLIRQNAPSGSECPVLLDPPCLHALTRKSMQIQE